VNASHRPLSFADLAERGERILEEIERAVVGKHDVLELVLLGLLANGHVLIEDNPGLAKTLIARSFAAATSMRFTRVQFTPDLMPADITGSNVYDQQRGEVSFRPGPIFTNILLGDEINRAPPKTQAALLEAMQERQVTVVDGTRRLERPFLVLATQNPIEYEAPTRCLRRSSTGSCCGSRWAIPTLRRRSSCSHAAWLATATRSSCRRSSTATS
jgi:MoxR-like ATPase